MKKGEISKRMVRFLIRRLKREDIYVNPELINLVEVNSDLQKAGKSCLEKCLRFDDESFNFQPTVELFISNQAGDSLISI